LSIPEWKREVVTIDFITKFIRIVKQHDFIMVVVDKLTKEANIVEIYMKEVVKLHGVPKTIVLDRDSKITSNFWKGLFKEFGKTLNLSTTYHQSQMGKHRGLTESSKACSKCM
jgi:GTP-binding protein EngB required for normal cell division